ncbi:hypothetical protein EP164_06865 [Photorhabdus luminescens subsp. sonorensis]|uniref:Uncharacterized protein n=1 Tax=Photorhabdus luminescens subsp. sonorensis TaxID=1173677 RepID=A0A5C4RJJ6_PHOLU|nr:hypothetical protein EP164_06865 [Photorhabdus luminescens subsp. sonorensis]
MDSKNGCRRYYQVESNIFNSTIDTFSKFIQKTKENTYKAITPIKYIQEVTRVNYPEQDDNQLPGTPFKYGVESVTQSYIESEGKKSGKEKLTFIISIHYNLELVGYISHSSFVNVL